MNIEISLRDGQLEATAKADFNEGALDADGIMIVGSCLRALATDALFGAMGDDDKGRLPAMPPNN